MKLKHLLSILLLAASVNVYAASHGGGHGHHKKQKGAGVMHPMPNLMRVITKHGDQLDLSEDQSAALAKWRGKSHGLVHAKMQQIRTIRTEMQNAVMDGANRAQINTYLASLDKLRGEIIDTKLKCRNNMKNLLNDKQWDTVKIIYRVKHM